MSRMTTSRASFSWATLAMRRACSSGVSRSGLLSGCRLSVAVQAPVLDLAGDRLGNQSVELLASAGALAQVARRNRRRVDLEEANASLVLRHDRRPLHSGSGGDAERNPLEHRVRLLPRGEVAVLVCAQQEDRVAGRLGAQAVDRVAVRIGDHLGAGQAGEREPRKGEPLLERGLDRLVPRVVADEHEQLVEVEFLERAARELDVPEVRWIEGAAEEPDHSKTSVSSPISISCPLRAPAARSACSSSSPSGARPWTRKPRSVRRIRYARADACGR